MQERQREVSGRVAPRGDRPARGLIVLGVLLVLVGLGWLLDTLGAVDLRWRTVLPAVLVVIGVALLAGARRQDHGGLVGLGIVVAILVLLMVPGPVVSPLAGIGERNERPTTLDDLQPEYTLAIGSLTVDLRAVDLTETREVRVSVGVGEVIVRLPDDATAQVRGRSGVGEVVIGDQSRGGVGPSAEETVGTGAPDIVLDVTVGIGRVEVDR